MSFHIQVDKNPHKDSPEESGMRHSLSIGSHLVMLFVTQINVSTLE